jgi:hypothetical protein
MKIMEAKERRDWGLEGKGWQEAYPKTNLCLLGYNAAYSSVKFKRTFKRNISPPPSRLKMEAACSSETSAGFHWTTRYIPEDRTLHNRSCKTSNTTSGSAYSG